MKALALQTTAKQRTPSVSPNWLVLVLEPLRTISAVEVYYKFHKLRHGIAGTAECNDRKKKKRSPRVFAAQESAASFGHFHRQRFLLAMCSKFSSDILGFLFNNTSTAPNVFFSYSTSAHTQCMRMKVCVVTPSFWSHMRANMSHGCQEIPDDGRQEIQEDNNAEALATADHAGTDYASHTEVTLLAQAFHM
eukprot:2096934-Amphidinium_carterae.1